MKIITKAVMRWDEEKQTWVTVLEESFSWSGPVDLCCGATPAQNNILQTQQNFGDQLIQQATSVYGDSSQVFNDLVSTFSPIVKAGPSQQGFSSGEASNLESSAITETGNAYRNASEAVGDSEAAAGGGNTDLSAGTTAGVQAKLATSAANQTSGELNQINEENYQVGRQNYEEAVAGMESAPGVFNPATSAAGAATSSEEGAANTANEIAEQNNSWIQGVTGALGGIAGATVTGGMKNLGSGVGFFGQNAPSQG